MAVYGYLRTSTSDQKLGIEAQRQAILAKYPAAIFLEEHASAKDRAGRPVFSALLERVCAEKAILVVSKLDRLCRDTRDALDIAECVRDCGASLDILNVGDVTGTVGTLILTILAAVAEMERSFISERTRDGLRQSTKELGGYRPRKVDAQPRKARKPDPRRALVNEMLDDGVRAERIAEKHAHIPITYVRQILRERQIQTR